MSDYSRILQLKKIFLSLMVKKICDPPLPNSCRKWKNPWVHFFLSLLIWDSWWFWNSYVWLWKQWVVSVECICVSSKIAALGNCSLRCLFCSMNVKGGTAAPSTAVPLGSSNWDRKSLGFYVSILHVWNGITYFFSFLQISQRKNYSSSKYNVVITRKFNQSCFYFQMFLLLEGH